MPARWGACLFALILTNCAALAQPPPTPVYVSDPADRHGWQPHPYLCYSGAVCNERSGRSTA